MCARDTPPAQRAMCGCYTRRAVLGVSAAVAVVVAAVFIPDLLVVAFVAAVIASVGVIMLARSRGPGFNGLVHRYTPQRAVEEVAPGPAPEQWWERSQMIWPPRSQEGGRGHV